MKSADLFDQASDLFRSHVGRPHEFAAYAPGRIEVLGNHTDYNEGCVLSAAITLGTCFLAASRADGVCRVTACGDTPETREFPAGDLQPPGPGAWMNYVMGVYQGLRHHGLRSSLGFDALFLGNVPVGAGLSSSAALEISAAMALSARYELKLEKLDLARIGQQAEHAFAGVRCGLLDQVTSLFGRSRQLVLTDFRTLEVESLPTGEDVCFLMCDTHTRHALAEGAYNERRRHCEDAVRFFASVLDHPVTALRDVSWDEWLAYSGGMDPQTARRAAHPIGEQERVMVAREALQDGDLGELGQLLFESHNSSQYYFENSCPELDAVVDIAADLPGVYGARLSGGGFGGSAVIAAAPHAARAIEENLVRAYSRRFPRSCDVRILGIAEGARLIPH